MMVWWANSVRMMRCIRSSVWRSTLWWVLVLGRWRKGFLGWGWGSGGVGVGVGFFKGGRRGERKRGREGKEVPRRGTYLLVASSKMTILPGRSIALAKQNSCLWPWLKKSTSISTSSPPLPSIIAHNSTFRNAVIKSSSLWLSHGSRFVLIVPYKKNGSCGMAFSRDRTSCRGTSEISMSSIKMLPWEISIMRKSASTREDLPLPLRPQMPIFSPGWMVRLKSWMTFLPDDGAYEIARERMSTRPLLGQLAGTTEVSMGRFSDLVLAAKDLVRLTAPIAVSSWVLEGGQTR